MNEMEKTVQERVADVFRRVAPVARRMRLDELRLVSIAGSRPTATDSHRYDVAANIEISFDAVAVTADAQPGGDGSCFAKVSFQLQGVVPESSPRVDLSAEFEIRYSVEAGDSLVEADLSAFANVNAVYQCWPYWRELVQSTIVRMNLPSLTLDSLRPEDAAASYLTKLSSGD